MKQGKPWKKAIVIIAIILIPLAYSFFYLDAFWDPYSRLESLPVALVNLDGGAEIQGEQRNVGTELVDELLEDNSLKWMTTTAEEAKHGLENRKYYAEIVIPEDFSSRIASADSADRQQGLLLYSANEKRNYLAAQILNRAVAQVETTISGKIDKEIANRMTVEFHKVPDQLQELNDGVVELKDGADQIDDGVGELLDGTTTYEEKMGELASGMSEIKDGAVTLSDGMGELEDGQQKYADGQGELNDGIVDARDGSLKLSAGMDDYLAAQTKYEAGVVTLRDGFVDLQAGVLDLKDGADELNKGQGKLDKGLITLLDGLKDARNGSDELSTGTTALANGLILFTSKLEAGETKAEELTAGTAAFAAGLDNLSTGASTFSAGLSRYTGSVATLSTGYTDFNSGLTGLATGLAQYTAGVAQVTGANSKLADYWANVAENHPELAADPAFAAMGAVLQQTTGAAVKLTVSATNLNAGATTLVGSSARIAAGLSGLSASNASLTEGYAKISGGAATLDTSFVALSGGVDTLVGSVGEAADAAAQLRDGSQKVDVGTADLYSGLCDAVDGTQKLVDGSAKLVDGQQTMTDGVQSLEDGTDEMGLGIDKLVTNAGKLTAAAGDLNNGTTDLVDGMNQLSDGSKTLTEKGGELLDGAVKLADGATELKDGIVEAEDGTGKLTDAAGDIRDGAAELKDGTVQMADGLQTADEKVSDAIVEARDKTSALDGIGDFVEAPVEVEENATNPVPDYGTAFAPYFMSLSMWVGALMMYFGIYMDERMRLRKRFDALSAGDFVPYALIGVVQAVVLAWVLQKTLGLRVQSVGAYYGSLILTSLCFVAIMQFLLVHLKSVGKFMAILILILQLTSCGGTFPMELVPNFFKQISPFLPMTYSVNVFKESISGLDRHYFNENMLVLAGFMLVFLLLSTVCFHVKRKFFSASDDASMDSDGEEGERIETVTAMSGEG